MTNLNISPIGYNTLVIDTNQPLLNVAIKAQLDLLAPGNDFMLLNGGELGRWDAIKRVPTTARLIIQVMSLLGVGYDKVRLSSVLIMKPVEDSDAYRQHGISNSSGGTNLSDATIASLRTLDPTYEVVFCRKVAAPLTVKWCEVEPTDPATTYGLHAYLLGRYGHDSLAAHFEYNPDGRSTDEGTIVISIIVIDGEFCPMVTVVSDCDLEDCIVKPFGAYSTYKEACDDIATRLHSATTRIRAIEDIDPSDYYGDPDEGTDEYFDMVIALGLDVEFDELTPAQVLVGVSKRLNAETVDPITRDLTDELIVPNEEYLAGLGELAYLQNVTFKRGC